MASADDSLGMRGADHQRMRHATAVIGIGEVDPDCEVAKMHLTFARGIKSNILPDESLWWTLLMYDLRHHHRNVLLFVGLTAHTGGQRRPNTAPHSHSKLQQRRLATAATQRPAVDPPRRHGPRATARVRRLRETKPAVNLRDSRTAAGPRPPSLRTLSRSSVQCRRSSLVRKSAGWLRDNAPP
jgi:hypothetical protein